ncbi:MAG TPA: DMT family transporter [Thermoanaerobaculia bacterium]|nr:DMT family transporter [Thermoanaerobaculia bacterium]
MSGGAGEQSERWPVHLALVSAQTGFALFPIFGKLALASMPAFVLAALRVLLASALLDLVRRAGRHPSIARRDRGAVLLYALLGVSFNQVLYILGLSLTTAINTTILTATIPIFTLICAVALGHEAMTARAAGALVLAGAGALLLLDLRHFDWHSRFLRGDLLLIGNAVCYSFYLVLSRPILARYSALTVVSRVFLYGAGPIVLVAIPSFAGFAPARVTPLSWSSLAAVVLFCTVLPYLAISWALARAQASRVAFYVFLQPLVASILAVLVLGERLSGRTAVAGALILAGLALSMVRGRLPSRPVP